jgi:tRNA 2-selenouridine synthase
MRPDSSDFRSLFLAGVPFMDTRAPVEFRKGTVPGAINLPLMLDDERQKVGTCYKQLGQQAAIELGHKLVSGSTKDKRIAAWIEFVQAHPEGYLYCWRGGLRSQIVQQWLKGEAGIDYPRITGGYKAMREYLMGVLESAARSPLWVVGGMTGTGKTDVILQFENHIDLEGCANHRGSSFGKHAMPQPAQIDFEHALAVDVLRKQAAGQTCFIVEDESGAVGSCSVPLSVFTAMQKAPLFWLEDSLSNRVERILRDYVVGLCDEFVALHGEEAGFTLFSEQLQRNLANITRRLGMERYQRLSAVMQQALSEQQQGQLGLHRVWIEQLLTDYYDPMYVFQYEQKKSRIVFAGKQDEIIGALRSHRVSGN